MRSNAGLEPARDRLPRGSHGEGQGRRRV